MLGEVARAPVRLAGRKNLIQLIQLRWLAVAGQLLTILVVQYSLGVRLPLEPMLSLLGLLVLFNLASWLRSRLSLPVGHGELFIGLLVDVAVLSGQLYQAGGVTNPFIHLYLVLVAVGSVLLRPAYIWALVLVTSLGFVALTQWHHPLALAELSSPTLTPEYIGGLLLSYVLSASLLVVFITRITRNLRQRDERLADLRSRAVEEEHIVRMGLLASGAAHELGTPLATLSVILGDWARMAPLAGEPELRADMEEMQRQLDRCKGIVSGILMSAGEARAVAPRHTRLHPFLDDLAQAWRGSHPGAELSLRRSGVPDGPIIADVALRQVLFNILDNALEAAPGKPIVLVAECTDEWLLLHVLDEGPGFAPEILARLGKPYQSSKGRPGRGLGLFLSVNVARSLGGRLEARHRPFGGAEVTLSLPLASLVPPH